MSHFGIIMKVNYLYLSLLLLLFGCSNTSEVTTEPDLIDYRNKKSYRTVKIGSQIWMAENLDVATFRNGDLIQEARTVQEWVDAGNKGIPAWCYYANDYLNLGKYGRLYNAFAVSDPRGLAPVGWHVPSDAEWKVLTDYLGDILIAGGKMKEVGFNNWNSPNTAATNSSGFSAIPGGLRHFDGSFLSLGNEAYWWSTTNTTPGSYWIRWLDFVSENVNVGAHNGKRGIAVRCMKD